MLLISMDPAPSASPDLLIKPDHHPPVFIPDQPFKPLILIFDGKIKPNHSVLSAISANHQPKLQACAISPNDQPQAQACAISCSASATAEGDQTAVITGISYQSGSSAAEAGELWPKLTELDDSPLSPDYHKEFVIKKMISESTYLFPKQTEVNYRPQSPDSNAESSKRKVISESAYQSAKQIIEKDDRASTPTNESAVKPEKMLQVIRETAYQSGSEAKLEVNCSAASSADDQYQGAVQQKPKVIREDSYQSSTQDKLSEMKESCRTSARGRLSRVVEESESFSRREFGANVLNYMSTHSSASHAENLSNLSSYNHKDYSNFMNSKSAPAGSAARTGSTFTFFRRGMSEGGHLGGRAVYRRQRSRKQRSLGSRLLWPLLKIRNGYVGCMMGLEGAGDLSGMAQGGTYATASRYFADVPLSKTDSRNHG